MNRKISRGISVLLGLFLLLLCRRPEPKGRFFVSVTRLLESGWLGKKVAE